MARCNDHVGEIHPPRSCAACDLATVQEAAARVEARLVRYRPESDCPRHHGYPLSDEALPMCDRCARDILEAPEAAVSPRALRFMDPEVADGELLARPEADGE